jgi:hypothetical protein
MGKMPEEQKSEGMFGRFMRGFSSGQNNNNHN